MYRDDDDDDDYSLNPYPDADDDDDDDDPLKDNFHIDSTNWSEFGDYYIDDDYDFIHKSDVKYYIPKEKNREKDDSDSDDYDDYDEYEPYSFEQSDLVREERERERERAEREREKAEKERARAERERVEKLRQQLIKRRRPSTSWRVKLAKIPFMIILIFTLAIPLVIYIYLNS